MDYEFSKITPSLADLQNLATGNYSFRAGEAAMWPYTNTMWNGMSRLFSPFGISGRAGFQISE